MAEWLTDKVVLVVGGGSGIGRGVVETFLDEGAKVGTLEIDQEKVDDLNESEQNIIAIQGDATKYEDCKRAVKETTEKYDTLDSLVCCVGLWDFFTGVKDIPEDQIDSVFRELFDANVKSYILNVKASLPALTKSNGNIILTVSNAGFYPAGGGPLYTATKFAVRGLIIQLAHELAPSIRVNGVAPGGTLTELTGPESLGLGEETIKNIPEIEQNLQANPLEVLSTPEDHSWAYLYLASNNHARTVTGAIIPTDGGLKVRGL